MLRVVHPAEADSSDSYCAQKCSCLSVLDNWNVLQENLVMLTLKLWVGNIQLSAVSRNVHSSVRWTIWMPFRKTSRSMYTAQPSSPSSPLVCVNVCVCVSMCVHTHACVCVYCAQKCSFFSNMDNWNVLQEIFTIHVYSLQAETLPVLCVCVCVCVCVYTCMWLCRGVCMCTHACMCVYVLFCCEVICTVRTVEKLNDQYFWGPVTSEWLGRRDERPTWLKIETCGLTLEWFSRKKGLSQAFLTLECLRPTRLVGLILILLWYNEIQMTLEWFSSWNCEIHNTGMIEIYYATLEGFDTRSWESYMNKMIEMCMTFSLFSRTVWETHTLLL